MGIVTGLVLAYSAYQGKKSSDKVASASSNGAKTQSDAAMAGIDYQREALNQLIGLQQPYMNMGSSFLPAYSDISSSPADRSALDAAYQALGFTRTPIESSPAPNQATQLSGYSPETNLSPEGASIIGRSTYTPNSERRTIQSGVTPNAAGRDVYGNSVFSATPTTQQQAVQSGTYTTSPTGQLIDPDGNYEGDSNFYYPGENGIPANTPVVPYTPPSQPQQPAAPYDGSSTTQNQQPAQQPVTPVNVPNQQYQTTYNAPERPLVNQLNSLISSPDAQVSYVRDNPFFNSLADNAQNRLFSNQAARGKVGSGGTASQLQDNLLRMGTDLINNQIGNLSTGIGINEGIRSSDLSQLLGLQSAESGYKQNLLNQLLQPVQIGQNAASLTGSNIQQGTNNITNLLGNSADAQAAGMIGSANAKAAGRQNLYDTLLYGSLYLSDARFKTDIKHIGFIETPKATYPFYEFKYLGSDNVCRNVMAQDVEKITPDAVKEINGIKFVDGGKL